MRKILILTVLAFIFTESYSQVMKEDAPPISERLFFGGSFNLQFGTITDIEVAPVVGFWILPKIAVAAGPSYTFYKDPLGQTSIYGGRAYAEYLVFRDLNEFIPVGLHTGLLLHAEDEALSLSLKELGLSADNGRTTINTVLAGIGINQQMGSRASINLMILWALNNSPYYSYSNPVIRIGFQF